MQQVVSLNFHENWHKKDKLFICMEYGKLFAAKDYLNFVFIQRAYCEAVTNVINRLRTRNILNSIKFIKKQRNRILVTSVSLFLARFQIWRCTKEDMKALIVRRYHNGFFLKIILVALVWLFSTVRFQMFPQRDSLDWCKVTLVALDWIFSTVCFKMPASENVKSHWSHFFNFSPCLKTFSHDIYSLCVFNIFSNRLSLCMQSHIGCIYSTCPHVWKTKMLSCGDKSYI